MTREEAISILDEWVGTGRVGEDCSIRFAADLDDVETALDMAISALREQEERKPCKWCEDMDEVYEIVCYLPHDNGSANDIPLRFCPMCGRRLEEV